MSEEFDGMLDIYLYENGQLLEQLENTTLDHRDDEKFADEIIQEFFRVMHTIKGSSGIMMFDDITEVSHKMEDVFYYIRESKTENNMHAELIEMILRVADFIRSELEKIKEGFEPDGDAKDLIKSLQKFLEELKKGIEKEGIELPPEKKKEETQQFYIPPIGGSVYYRIDMKFRSDTEMVSLRAYTATFQLRDYAEELFYFPEDIMSSDGTDDIILDNGFQMLLKARERIDDIHGLLSASGIDEITVEEIDEETFSRGLATPTPQVVINLDDELEEKKPEEKTVDKSVKPGDYVLQEVEPGKPKQLAKQNRDKNHQQIFISVDVSKVDMLMDLIGEIVIAESVVLQNPDLKVPGLSLVNFQKAASQLSKFTSELQDVIMSMRMMPLTNTFQKMNRIVFDVSRKLGKDVELQLIGDKTEVDKNIIEHISDPLMHLIRNSLDHGIELPEERTELGKNPRGTVSLEAKSEGGKVLLIVRDDGKGMNVHKIFDKAQEKGMTGDKKFDEFSQKDIFRFITCPGFSTKEEVTELSGRGVGMDVVVRNIQEIGGNLEIDSIEGKGTEMTIKIPLTLAIIDGILMEVGHTTFAIETGNIKEFIKLRERNLVSEPNGSEYVMIRDECFPLIRMNRRYGIKEAKTSLGEGVVVVVNVDGKQVCLLADHLIGEQEIVVKPIPSYIRRVKGISGCTQLGDGTIALIVDAGGLG